MNCVNQKCCLAHKRLAGVRHQIVAVLLLLGAITHGIGQGQVYSINVIGYCNKDIPLVASITLAYIANPLNTVDNHLSSVLPDLPNGTMVYAYRANAFEAYTYFNGWLPADASVGPGEGLILALDRSTAPDPTRLSFVGELAVGTMANVIPPGMSLKSSRAPLTGLITSQLSLNPRDGDELILFNENTQARVPYDFVEIEWFPSEPLVRVAEAFWYFNASGTANNWIQSVIPNSIEALDALAEPSLPSQISAPQTTAPCWVGPVSLKAGRTGRQVNISWPGELGAFQLEHSTTLTGSWASVSQTPDTANGRRQITLTPSSRDFYRLNSGPVLAPALYWKICDSSTVTLFWHRSFTGFRVDQRASLTSGGWAPVVQNPTDTNGFWQVTVAKSAALNFYRLSKN